MKNRQNPRFHIHTSEPPLATEAGYCSLTIRVTARKCGLLPTNSGHRPSLMRANAHKGGIMIKKSKFKKKGVSLTEVLLSVSFAAIILLAVAVLLRLTTTLRLGVQSELQSQGNLRAISTTINNNVRNASAVYIIPHDSFQSGHRDDGWSYIGLRVTGYVDGVAQHELVLCQWVPDPSHPDGGTRNEIILARADEIANFDLEFALGDSSNMLNFSLSGTDLTSNNRERGFIENDVRAIGAEIVYDMTATYGGNPTVIAFRTGWDYAVDILTAANVTMIVDRTTSMTWCMEIDEVVPLRFQDSRIFH